MSPQPEHNRDIQFLTRASIAITVLGLLVVPLGWISLTHWVVVTIVLAVLVVAARRRHAERRGENRH